VLEAGGVRVLDYSRLGISDEGFSNTDHLNDAGATRFSKLVRERIAVLVE